MDEFAFPLLVLILVGDTEAFPLEEDAAAFPLLTFFLRGIAETLDEFVNDEVLESSSEFSGVLRLASDESGSLSRLPPDIRFVLEEVLVSEFKTDRSDPFPESLPPSAESESSTFSSSSPSCPF